VEIGLKGITSGVPFKRKRQFWEGRFWEGGSAEGGSEKGGFAEGGSEKAVLRGRVCGGRF